MKDIAKDYAERREGVELGIARAPVIVPEWQAQEIRGIVEAIQRKIPAGDPIFVAPYAPGVYFLAERPNPTRHDAIVPGFATVEIQQEVIQALEHEQVRLVVIHLTEIGGKARWWIPSFAPRLWRHLTTTYVQERTIGRFRPAATKEPGLSRRFALARDIGSNQRQGNRNPPGREASDRRRGG